MRIKPAVVLLLGVTILLSACQRTNMAKESDAPSQAPVNTSLLAETPSPGVRAIHQIRNFQMLDASHGWLYTETAIMRTDDGGQTWQNVTPPDSGIEQITRGGTLLPQVTFQQPEVAVISIPQQDNGTVSVYRTTDSGKSWMKSDVRSGIAPQATPAVKAVSFTDRNNGWMLLAYDTAMGSESVELFRTADSGATWQTLRTSSDPSQPMTPGVIPSVGIKNGLTFHDLHTGWLNGNWHGDGAWLYATHDGGTTWKSQTIQVPSNLPSEGGAVSTYQPEFLTERSGLLPVQFSLTTLIFYMTEDGGNTWSPTTPLHSTTGERFIWSFTDANHGFATDGNELYMTTDGAMKWDTVPRTLALKGILGLHFLDDQIGYAYGNDWMKKTTDGGISWTDIS